jgi:hypothetical protein
MSVVNELKNQLETCELMLHKEAIQLAELEQVVQDRRKEKQKLKRALAILEETDTVGLQEPSPPPSEKVEPVKPVAPRPIDNAPVCTACDKGRLRPSVKKAPSGVYINMLQCDDGGCNNEVY